MIYTNKLNFITIDQSFSVAAPKKFLSRNMESVK
jgi:hypothetical protein